MHPSIPLDVVCPYSFPHPIAPAAAAALAGVTITPSHLLSAAAIAQSYGSPLVVETAGGLLTPYATQLTSADLAGFLGFPVILIARNGLGTINHTALAVAEIRRRQLPLLGIILVTTQASTTPDQPSNSSMIAEQTGLPPLGTLPFVPSHTPAVLAMALQSALDLQPLFACLS